MRPQLSRRKGLGGGRFCALRPENLLKLLPGFFDGVAAHRVLLADNCENGTKQNEKQQDKPSECSHNLPFQML
jgi:hypothetical protein